MNTPIEIKGMTCGHCVAAVKKALEGVPGVERADVDLAAGRATVVGSPERAALLAAVREEGCEAA